MTETPDRNLIRSANENRLIKTTKISYCHLKANDSKQWGKINFSRLPVEDGFTGCTIEIYSVNILNAIRTIEANTDFISLNNIKYYFPTDRTSMNASIFVAILNQVIESSNIKANLTETNLLRFISSSPFTIDDASYNIRLMIGSPDLPTEKSNVHIMNSIGYYASTNKLYILSNLTGDSYKIDSNGEIDKTAIFMTLANASMTQIPINYRGGEQKHSLDIGLLMTNGYFELVDSNLNSIYLLSPMEITLKLSYYRFDKQI